MSKFTITVVKLITHTLSFNDIRAGTPKNKDDFLLIPPII